MPEFFLELFSEEIPARMQLGVEIDLLSVCKASLSSIRFDPTWFVGGPRRIAVFGTVNATNGGGNSTEMRGPREGAPTAAIEGFARKHDAEVSSLKIRNGSYVFDKEIPSKTAFEVIESELPQAITKLTWPKSMRWGQSGDFVWVRPLRRIVCLLDNEIVPIRLANVTASNITEGHRFLSKEPFEVNSAKNWKDELFRHYVIADQAERRDKIVHGLASIASKNDLSLVEDDKLLDEVNGLVEWPVPLIGRIDDDFMDLPPEVRELSMKVNQRYFALRDATGKPAPYFAFISNIEATDGGKAIISGNERVLRARLSDARHFWDLDLKTPLDELLPKLDKITFHAKIGTQGERVKRIAALADEIALALGADDETARQAGIAGMLSKADLVTGMVSEFPELQGIIGGYYAEKNPRSWNGALVGPAITTHYQPKGPSDAVPTGIVAISVALADKLDTLIEFFRINEKPTGSGDPYALRRAALGVIRIILENNLLLTLQSFVTNDDLRAFIVERLRVKLRSEGKRFDILDAVLAARFDGNLVGTMQRVEAVNKVLGTIDGTNFYAGIKRATNILRIEDPNGQISNVAPNRDLYREPEEKALAEMLDDVRDAMIQKQLFQNEQYEEAMSELASLRPAIDSFFERVTVNDVVPEVRQNRMRLLASICRIANQIADFSKIEG